MNGIVPPFYEMLAQNLLDEPIFSFRIGNSSTDGGEAVFGGIDPSHYSGTIDYVPVQKKGYWEVDLAQVSLGDKVSPGRPDGQLQVESELIAHSGHEAP